MLVLSSCSTTKYVPEDKYLLSDVEVKIDNPNIDKEEAKRVIQQKENYRFLGITKFYLWLYNLSSKKNEDSWLKKIGEEPVIYDESLVFSSKERLKQFLANRGYFESNVTAETKTKEKKRLAYVTYNIETGDQYKIKSIQYNIPDSALNNIFQKNKKRIDISPGDPFELEKLDEQREAIAKIYRNRGYFYFTPRNIRYLADTINLNKKVDLDLFIDKIPNEDSTGINLIEPYRVNNFHVYAVPINATAIQVGNKNVQYNDTTKWGSVTLYQNSGDKYRTRMFKRALKMNSGQLYKDRDAERTFNAFNRLNVFRYIDMQFKRVNSADTNLLDCYIQLAPLNRQSISFDIEGSNTSGNFGMAGSVNYQHKNLFRGGEIFNLSLKGGIERQERATLKGDNQYFNTRDFGFETSIALPQLIGPGKYVKSFEDFLPKTVISAGYNFQLRPEYSRRIINAKFGYDWKSTNYLRHRLNVIDFNMVGLDQFDEDFLNLIRDLYIKSSFTDHLIFAANYSLIYNTQQFNSTTDYRFLRFNVESAGSILNLVSRAIGQNEYNDNDTTLFADRKYYRIFKTRYAQYIKSDIEYRRGWYVNPKSSFVTRAFIGAAVPYGNSTVLPFEKKYFTGGANGIRAWRVRSLGPGLYKPPSNAYPNQSSDIKLEMNAEYRFNIIRFLEGAFFVDAGNIWSLKDNREGTNFNFKEFYKQIAIGTGTGLRFDFNYFLFRLDIGVKVREPRADFFNGWIINERSYKPKDFNFTFAIGYPF